jgi:hypothetical protein
MGGRHLILGKLADLLTGETLDDTHDERFRQAIGRLLLDKGHPREDLAARVPVFLSCGDKSAVFLIAYTVALEGKTAMVVHYGPGSIVTRERPALAASRLVSPFQAPVAVAANGVDARVLRSRDGKFLGEGLSAIPSRERLEEIVRGMADPFPLVAPERKEKESRILYTYEFVGACNCEDCNE